MLLNDWLWIILLGSGCSALILWAIMKYISSRSPWQLRYPYTAQQDLPFHKLALRYSYNSFSRIPLVRARLYRTRQSLVSLYGYNEWLLRERTAIITWGYLVVWGCVLFLFFLFEQDWISIIMLLLLLHVSESLYIDLVLQRADLKLLKHSFHWFSHIRFAYQRHRMVEQAVEDALEHAPDLVRPHSNRLLSCVSATEGEQALAAYDESAPNRHYRLLARLLRLVADYGDPGKDNQSSLLKGISMIIREMQSEYVMRYKLGILLKGLRAIAVIPILFANPIEHWARNYFPLMNSFYDSELGLLTRLIVFVTVLCCNHLLNELQWRHTVHTHANHLTRWKRRKLMMYEYSVVKKIVYWWIKRVSSVQLRKQRQLLQEMNASIGLERWYTKRLVYAVIAALSLLICSILIPVAAKHHLDHNTALWLGAEGRNSPSSVAWEIPVAAEDVTDNEFQAQQQLMKDYQDWVYQLPKHTQTISQQNQYYEQQVQAAYPEWSEWKRKAVINHLLLITAQVQYAGWQWWWLLLPLLGSVAGYMLPIASAKMKKRFIAMDIQIEVSQFHMLVLLLRAFDRMTAERVVEWMANSSTISRAALQRCLVVWDRGADRALSNLKQEMPHPEFIRFLEQLELAHEQLPLHKAFDDAEQSWNHDQEMRREWEENMIETRSVWGQWIGFAPMYTIVFLYLVLPLLWLSAEQMSQSFRQIQTLS